MAVDLTDLLDSLRREVSVPGAEGSTFPDATDDTFLGHLRDAFWEARLDGLLAGYNEVDGLVSPISPSTTELTRDLQQLVVLYAGIRIIRNQLIALNTVFRAKAGPVEYETQKSAQLLTGILNELKSRRNLVLERLADLGYSPSYYIDAVVERDHAIDYGLTTWAAY